MGRETPRYLPQELDNRKRVERMRYHQNFNMHPLVYCNIVCLYIYKELCTVVYTVNCKYVSNIGT